MKQLICLAADRWDSRPGRTRRFLSMFPDTEILYFEPFLEGIPRVRDDRVNPMTYVYTLPPVSPVDDAMLRLGPIDLRRLLQCILKAADRHSFDNPLLWVCSPYYYDLLSELDHSALVYDCDRPWYNIPLDWESRLTENADVVFAASPGLKEHLSPCSGNILTVPFGYEKDSFLPPDGSPVPIPAELLRLKRPVFGYLGTLWRELDLAPAVAAAEAHPEWTFLFVGRVSAKNPDVPRLKRLPNVLFTGYVNSALVPGYLQCMDVGLSFIRMGEEDCDVLSPRIYEYFSRGIPVAAMYHHLRKEIYPTLIDSAYSAEGFVRVCGQCAADRDGIKRAQRMELARKKGWDSRCRRVWKIIEDNHLL